MSIGSPASQPPLSSTSYYFVEMENSVLSTPSGEIATNSSAQNDYIPSVTLSHPIISALSNSQNVALLRTTPQSAIPATNSRVPRVMHNAIVKKRGGSKPARAKRVSPNGGRGTGFTQTETDSLLELLEAHLPLGRDEWADVLQKHMLRYPENSRNIDSLKRNFASLHRQKTPTGDPMIPPDVLLAKRIRKGMTERADLGDGEEAGSYVDETMPSEHNSSIEEDCMDMPELLHTQATTANCSYLAISTPSVVDDEDGERPTSAPIVPRPLVRKRPKPGPTNSSSDELLSFLKVTMIQEQTQREQDRGEARLTRQEEQLRREEDRARREKETKRHSQFMEMMMLMIAKQGNGSS